MADLPETDKIVNFAKNLGFTKINSELLTEAFTHSSYAWDNPPLKNNERLEFLGDAVLKLAVSNMLYKSGNIEVISEGKMSEIRGIAISDRFLVNFANELNFKDLIFISEGFKKEGGLNMQSTLSCAFEAFLGALFVAGEDISKIFDFVEKLYKKYENDLKADILKFNAKAILQEYTQSKAKDLPKYEIISQDGKGSKLTFTAQVSYEGQILGTGVGRTKKEAEIFAASEACIKLNLTEKQ